MKYELYLVKPHSSQVLMAMFMLSIIVLYMYLIYY